MLKRHLLKFLTYKVTTKIESSQMPQGKIVKFKTYWCRKKYQYEFSRKDAPARGEFCRGVGDGCGLVEAQASDVGFFDEVGVVTLGLVEGKGEVLDAVLWAELHEEVDELSAMSAPASMIFAAALGVCLGCCCIGLGADAEG